MDADVTKPPNPLRDTPRLSGKVKPTANTSSKALVSHWWRSRAPRGSLTSWGRGLPIGITLVVAVAMLVSGTASAVPRPGGTASIRADLRLANAPSQTSQALNSSAPCFGSSAFCQSTNPLVNIYYAVTPAIPQTCAYDAVVNWGDGTGFQSVQGETAPNGGPNLVAAHYYLRPGTYNILLTGDAESPCVFVDAQLQFILTPSTTQPAPTIFTFQGSIPLPNNTADPNSDQASGSTTLAKGCNSALFAIDEGIGKAIVGAMNGLSTTISTPQGNVTWPLGPSPNGSILLGDFLAGSQVPKKTGQLKPRPVNLSNTAVPGEIARSSQFQDLNTRLETYVATIARTQNTTNIPIPTKALGTPVLATLNYPVGSISDLFLTFGGTQGITVTGSGSFVNGRFQGTATYTIYDTYGFSSTDYFLGFGVAMRYLQTQCGAPYPGGAQWFPDYVTFTFPFFQPT